MYGPLRRNAVLPNTFCIVVYTDAYAPSGLLDGAHNPAGTVNIYGRAPALAG